MKNKFSPPQTLLFKRVVKIEAAIWKWAALSKEFIMECTAAKKATWISWIELWKRCVEDDLELLHNKRISKEPITSTDQKKMQSGQLIMDSLALSFWNVVIVLPRVKFYSSFLKNRMIKKELAQTSFVISQLQFIINFMTTVDRLLFSIIYG